MFKEGERNNNGACTQGMALKLATTTTVPLAQSIAYKGTILSIHIFLINLSHQMLVTKATEQFSMLLFDALNSFPLVSARDCNQLWNGSVFMCQGNHNLVFKLEYPLSMTDYSLCQQSQQIFTRPVKGHNRPKEWTRSLLANGISRSQSDQNQQNTKWESNSWVN